MVNVIPRFNTRSPEVQKANTPSLAFLPGLVLPEATFLGTLGTRVDVRDLFCADVCAFQWLF
jgi:hypothetical protein